MNTSLNLNKRTSRLLQTSLLICTIALLSCDSTSKEKIGCDDYPQPVGYVNDFEQVFDSVQLQSLTNLVTAYEVESTNEIAIASVTTIEPDSNIDQFSLNLARCWGVGKADKNNGVLIVFSKSLRQIHIQNGTGIEQKLTNVETQIIINSIILPEFKSGNFYSGIQKGVLAITKELE